jgi:hypothetical protein
MDLSPGPEELSRMASPMQAMVFAGNGTHVLDVFTRK